MHGIAGQWCVLLLHPATDLSAYQAKDQEMVDINPITVLSQETQEPQTQGTVRKGLAAGGSREGRQPSEEQSPCREMEETRPGAEEIKERGIKPQHEPKQSGTHPQDGRRAAPLDGG